MNMKYIRVSWKHENLDTPILLYSELDGDRWEIRKVEVFRDGTLGYADRSTSKGDTFLGLEPIPPLAQIGLDPQFGPEEITKDEFDEIWLRAIDLAGSKTA